MKKLIQLSIDYPVTVLMAVLAVLLLGTISFQKLGMDLFPELDSPRLFIELTAGENPPEEIEKQFVKNIESQAIRQKNAVQVTSVSMVGSAQVTVEYAWDTDMDEAFLSLQRALSSISQNEEIEELTVSQYDPNASPIIILGFSHPEVSDMDELRRVAESYIRNELVRLEGIADVRLIGQEEKEVVIQTDQYVLDAFRLSTSTLANRIEQYNRNVSGGSITEMGTKYVIQGVSEFTAVEDIEQVVVAYEDPAVPEGATAAGQSADKVPVYLKDVAEIHIESKKPDNIVRINGRRCMALAVYKETRYNTVKASNELFETLASIRARLPAYEFILIQDRGEFITQAIDEVQQTLVFGIVLAVIILFVFLRRIGTTVIISLAIPISIVATFNLMYFKGLTLNIMTLGGLALGAGMLVDNAIVVMENIFRNLEEKLPLKEAILVGTSQVSGAITASTITTIIVFLPIVYLHGTEGELFKDQALTVAFSLLSSLAVALFVIPMLSRRLLKERPETKRTQTSIRMTGYQSFLSGILKVRWPVILFAAALVAGAFCLLPVVGSEFIPKTDTGEYTIDVTLPEGTDLYRTESTVSSIEKGLHLLFGESIETLYTVIGPSWETDEDAAIRSENRASVHMKLRRRDAPSAVRVFADLSGLLDGIPDLESRVYQEQTALELTIGTETAPVAVELRGEDLEIIEEYIGLISEKISSLNDLHNVETNLESGRPEINIKLDPFRAAVYNVSVQTLISQLQSLLAGVEAGQLDAEGDLRDIRIALPEISVSELQDINVTSGNTSIGLSSIANIETEYSPKAIYRRNQARTGTVTAQLAAGAPLDKVVKEMETALADISFPPDYTYEIAGEERQRAEAFANLRFALILSLVLVYMVLASQFESLVHPFTIILSIPLAGVGAIAAFFILGMPLNIMAYIGIIMLAGIAVNDSIILVDAINQLKRDGLPRTDAILEAGRRRIRPIIMTSLTTILALFPLTIGFGEGASLRAPMALAVIGGLVSATILTLIVIPCVYSVVDTVNDKIRGSRAGLPS